MNTNRKNALIIAYNDLNNSGVPNVIYQTIKSLSDFYNFDIVVFDNNTFYFDYLKNEGINNIKLIKFNDTKPLKRIKRFFWYIGFRNKSFYRQCYNLLRNKKYDVVHSFKEYDSWPFLKACKKRGIQKRILHGTVIHKTPSGLLNRHLYRKNRKLSLKYATTFIGVSKLCCDSTFSNKNYSIIYNSYNTTQFNLDVINKLPYDRLVLTQVGTFNDNKNQLFSINVLFELLQVYPNSFLKLIGKETGAGYLNQIKLSIKNKNLSNHVEIIDGTKGVGNSFEYTTFALMPSCQEGAGITAIEAQACGIKVFTSTNVTKEMDAGGLISLSLESGPKEWALKIFEEFKKSGNNRQHYNLDRFSLNSFKKSIKSIYDN